MIVHCKYCNAELNVVDQFDGHGIAIFTEPQALTDAQKQYICGTCDAAFIALKEYLIPNKTEFLAMLGWMFTKDANNIANWQKIQLQS